MTENTSL